MLNHLGSDDVIQVKLTGDGTNIGRSVHVVNIAFTLLNDQSSVSSPHGNHSLAIFKIAEDYNSLKLALDDILKEASELKNGTIQWKYTYHRVLSWGRYEVFSSCLWYRSSKC